MKAKEARELTNKRTDEVLQMEREKAERFCEELSAEIKDATQLCKTSLQAKLPEELATTIRHIIKDAGYGITEISKYIIVLHW